MLDVYLVKPDGLPWEFSPRQALWMCRTEASKPPGAQEPFPGPREAAKWCMIPPRGMTFFGYHPEKHGPLAKLRYETARYQERARWLK